MIGSVGGMAAPLELSSSARGTGGLDALEAARAGLGRPPRPGRGRLPCSLETVCDRNDGVGDQSLGAGWAGRAAMGGGGGSAQAGGGESSSPTGGPRPLTLPFGPTPGALCGLPGGPSGAALAGSGGNGAAGPTHGGDCLGLEAPAGRGGPAGTVSTGTSRGDGGHRVAVDGAPGWGCRPWRRPPRGGLRRLANSGRYLS